MGNGGKSTNPLPEPITGIERKTWLKLLGTTLQNDPNCWDLQVNNLISKASSRMHILRICRSYGYSKKQFSSTHLLCLYFLMESKYGVQHLKRSTWNGLINSLGEHTDMDTQQKVFR
ncbi:Hypothetical predicted protein [Paramuricea clavata]|uniref:Uncharacterized protein n=1 Tax=Paramuricea clavata TaxID=317549 RepID=A0A6S7GIE9_PARCT|nr:Hypothetical predicted protein [Paramuricea clavata]